MRHELIDIQDGLIARFCLKCKAPISGRPNKIYCSANCRKRSSEPTRNSFYSPTKRRENMEFFDRAKRLAEDLYQTRPPERLGYMKDLIEYARHGGDSQLKDILCNRILLKPHPVHDRHLFYRRSRSYLTIAQAASNYCKRFWRANVRCVVYGLAQEPSDGTG